MTRHTTIAAGLMGLAALLPAGPAEAQKMYRCGNTYQETPCTGNQTATKELRANSAPTATASAGSDAECARLAEESQKISWAREGGATAEKQLADAKGGEEQRRLIESVYRKRGTAPEVRASIERDCLAEKERMRKAIELQRAAGVASGEGQAAGAAAKAQQETKAAERQAAQDAKAAEQRKQREKEERCGYIKSQLAEVEKRYRGGSSSQAGLSNLRDQRSKLEASAREQECEY